MQVAHRVDDREERRAQARLVRVRPVRLDVLPEAAPAAEVHDEVRELAVVVRRAQRDDAREEGCALVQRDLHAQVRGVVEARVRLVHDLDGDRARGVVVVLCFDALVDRAVYDAEGPGADYFCELVAAVDEFACEVGDGGGGEGWHGGKRSCTVVDGYCYY